MTKRTKDLSYYFDSWYRQGIRDKEQDRDFTENYLKQLHASIDDPIWVLACYDGYQKGLGR